MNELAEDVLDGVMNELVEDVLDVPLEVVCLPVIILAPNRRLPAVLPLPATTAPYLTCS